MIRTTASGAMLEQDPGGPIAGSTTLHILLAEDHPVNQKVAIRMLEGLGHTVDLACNGKQAIQRLEVRPYDIVLMDVQMPEMDGIEAVQAIRRVERDHGKRTRVVALTAHALHEDRERCLDAGFDGYLTKPIRQEALVATLGEHIPSLPPSLIRPESNPVIAGLLTACDQDDAFARELAQSVMTTAPRNLSRLCSAIERRDGPGLASEAHGMKGMCHIIRADELAESCERLEQAGNLGQFERAVDEMRELEARWEIVHDALNRLIGEGDAL